MSFIIDAANALGLRQTPWVIRAYLALLFACVALMVFAMLQGDKGQQVLTLSIDSFKTVLGAVIGSLSTAATAQWGSRRGDADTPENHG
jgi:hypothetical protein